MTGYTNIGNCVGGVLPREITILKRPVIFCCRLTLLHLRLATFALSNSLISLCRGLPLPVPADGKGEGEEEPNKTTATKLVCSLPIHSLYGVLDRYKYRQCIRGSLTYGGQNKY